jgi:hypothetical protein
MDESIFRERRDSERVRFSRHQHPCFQIYAKEYPITDLSEHGLRFWADRTGDFEDGRELEGRVLLQEGPELEIRGTVSRIEDGQVAIVLDAAFPMELVPKKEFDLIKSFHCED